MSFLRELSEILIYVGIIFLVAMILLYIRAYLVNRVVSLSFWKLSLKTFLRVAALVLIIAAWLGPHVPDKKTTVNVKATSKDIMVALDLSHSMQSNDLKPKRLERAKLAIGKIVRQLTGDNWGIVIFSSNAFPHCPLTYDTEYFMKMLEFCTPRLVPNKGTDLFPALNVSLERLTHRDQISNKSKIILLISDGEDFGDEMEDMAKKIRKEGIKVFCIGVGTSKGGTIKIGQDYKRDREGNIVRTNLKSKQLKKLAEITGGQYFEISDKRNDVNLIVNKLKSIKGETVANKKNKAPKTTFYHYFLYFALFFLCLDYVFKLKLVDY